MPMSYRCWIDRRVRSSCTLRHSRECGNPVPLALIIFIYMNWIPAFAGMTSNIYYMNAILAEREQKVVYDKKWFKFSRRARLFRFIPFVEFALGAGSMAVGNVTSCSDFDVIIGARQGRIFTARFLAVTAFGIFGWRRKRLDHSETAQDKVCLNHFVTERAFCLAGPHTDSWRNLYANLVPIYGLPARINDFWAANSSWMVVKKEWGDDLRHRYRGPSWFKSSVEFLLSGIAGDILEVFLKYIQVARIGRSLRAAPLGYKPRIIYTDYELEFHPDRAKFER